MCVPAGTRLMRNSPRSLVAVANFNVVMDTLTPSKGWRSAVLITPLTLPLCCAIAGVIVYARTKKAINEIIFLGRCDDVNVLLHSNKDFIVLIN